MSNSLLAGATTTTAATTTSAVEKLSQQYASQRSGSGTTTSTATKQTGTASGMGQGAFLKMFMAQMTNQNPLDPMDNTQFTAQLAQFSSLEQLTEINKSLSGLSGLQDTMTQSQALSYLGKQVTMSGNQIAVNSGQASSTGYTLAANSYVQAIVSDSSGKLVATKDLGYQSAGSNTFTWDGSTDAGTAAADGAYTVTIQAIDTSGSSVSVTDQTVTGKVTGVSKGSDGKTYLQVGNAKLLLSNVTNVTQPSDTSSTSTTDWMTSLYNSYSSSTSSSSQSFSDWLSSLLGSK